MEFRELKRKTKSDLHKILAESRDKLRDLRFKDANKQLKDVRQLRKIRQTIARTLMLLNVDKKADPPPRKATEGKQQKTKKKEKK